MIGLIRLRRPVNALEDVIALGQLPDPPTPRFVAFLVGCMEREEADETLEWYEEIRRQRPDTPLGLVCRARPHVLRAVAAKPYPIDPLLTPDDLVSGAPPAHALERLLDRSVVGTVVATWRERFGATVDEHHAFFSTLAMYGIRGAGVSAIARTLGTSSRTVHRRSVSLTGQAPHTLLLDGRIRAFDAAVSAGLDKATAMAKCGWYSPQAVHKARLRNASNRHGQ